MRSGNVIARLLGRGPERAPAAPAVEAGLQLADQSPGTDWSWRPFVMSQPMAGATVSAPNSGQRLSQNVAIWHDGEDQGLTVAQKAGSGDPSRAPFALMLDAAGFSGGYLSLSVDLPPSALVGLTKHHIVQMGLALAEPRDATIYARLNVIHGPNNESILRTVDLDKPLQAGRHIVEFDLDGTDMNENRLNKIWLDLIFDQPQNDRIELTDLLLSRHLRANF